jgi:hypothetical protein
MRLVTRLWQMGREYGDLPRLRLDIEIPLSYQASMEQLLQKAYGRHNGHLDFTVDTPRKPRTTGPLSQNHAIHGYGTQIEKWLTDGTTKGEIIEEAMARVGIQNHMNRFGRLVFKHESELSVEEAALIINELTEIARFVGCTLINSSQEAVAGGEV